VSQESADGSDFQILRRRVIYVALVLGGLRVISHVAASYVGYHEVQESLEEIHRMAPAFVPRKALLLVQPPGINMQFVLNVLMHLAVPACGYFGARQSNKQLLCCFCGCSGCASVMITLALGTSLALQGGLGMLEPTLEDWLQLCDPSPCMSLETNAQKVDCLAGEGWRTPAYDSGVHLASDCPQVFVRVADTVDVAVEDEACVYPKMGEQCGDPLRRAYCASMQDQGCGAANALAKCVPVEVEGKPLACEPVGLPLKPEEMCQPIEKNVQGFAAAAKLAPELIGRIEWMMKVNCFLMLPMVVLSCLATYWGATLYSKMDAGYATVGEPSFARTQMSHVQPVQAPAHGDAAAKPTIE